MNTNRSRREFLQTATIISLAGSTFSTRSAAQENTSDSWLQFGYDSSNTGFSQRSDVSGNGASRRWTLNTSEPVLSGISSRDRTVYFTDSSGRLYQVDAEGQTRIFEQGLQREETSNTPRQTSTPVISKENIYFGGLSGDVVCINTATGQEEWSSELSAAVHSSPIIHSDSICVGDLDGDVTRIQKDTGDEVWTYQTGEPVYSSPVLFDDSIYTVTEDGSVHRIDFSSGDGEQVTTVGGSVSASPVADSSKIFVLSTSGDILAIASTDDTVVWETSIGESVAATPAVANGTLYIGTEDGTAVGIDTDDGQELWTVNLTGGVQRGVAAANGTVLFGTADGFMYAVDIDAEEIRWEFDIGGEITTPISVANNVIYCGDADGQVFALTAESDPLNSLWDGIKTGDVEDVQETVSETVPREAQGIAGLSTAGVITYLTAGWLKRRRNQTDEAETTTNRTPASLSGDANPINKTTIVPQTELNISNAAYEDFEQIESIGSGGNADVYKARRDVDPSEFVALKIPRAADSNTLDASSFSDFLDEAEIWNDIDGHQRIVSIYAWGSTPLPWIAMEYMDSGDLSEQDLNYDGVFTELEGLAEGLHHAHRHGVTHTDIKPENILYTNIGGKTIGKLSDWGLANVLLDHSMSVAGLTPSYSAPEQFQPEKYGGTDERTDIYQLGVVAYELFTGERPFGASTQGEGVMAVLNDAPTAPSDINPDLTDDIDHVLLKVLSKQKEHRHETALHFRDDLRRAYRSFKLE